MAKCLVCDKELVINKCQAPDDGTVWHTTGNFGSTVYDDIGGNRRLVAYICDDCLVKKQESITHRFLQVKHSHLDIPWKPGE